VYTKKFSYKDCDIDIMFNLNFIAEYTSIDELCQICEIIINDKYYKKLYYINKKIECAKKYIENVYYTYKSKNSSKFLEEELNIIIEYIKNDKVKEKLFNLFGNDTDYYFRKTGNDLLKEIFRFYYKKDK